MSRWDKYVMTPYKPRGRSLEGADCFGLHLLILAHEAGLYLPAADIGLGDGADAMARAVEAEIVSGRWALVAEGDGAAVKRVLRVYDAVLMTGHVRTGREISSRPIHVGTAVGVRGLVIHTEVGVGAQCVPVDDPSICRRVRAVYRAGGLL